MNMFKKKVSLILAMIMLSITILPIFSVNAANTINYSLKINEKTISFGSTYEVKGGENIVFEASAAEGAKITTIAYQIDKGTPTQLAGTKVTIAIPEGEAGTEKTIYINAGGKDASGQTVQLGWKNFKIKYAEPAKVNIKLTLDSNKIETGKTYEVKGGEKIIFEASATKDAKITTIAYQIDKGVPVQSAGDKITITLPDAEENVEKTIYVNAGGKDVNGKTIQSGWKSFKVKYTLPKEEDVPNQINMTIKMDSKILKDGSKVEVEGGEKITVNTTTTKAPVERIGYYFYANGKKEGNTIDVYEKNITITVPTGNPGSKRYLYIEAIAADDNGTVNTVTKTGWIEIILNYKEEEIVVEPSKKELTIDYLNKKLVVNSKTEVNSGETLKITAVPTNETTKLQLKWDNENWITVDNVGIYSIRIPNFEAGTTHTLYVKAEYKDGMKVSEQKYMFEIPFGPSEVIPTVMLNDKTISFGKTYEIERLEKITFKAIATNGGKVTTMAYQIDSGKQNSIAGNEITIEIPEGEAGTTKKIYLNAGGKDSKGNVIQTGWKNITIKYKNVEKEEIPVEPSGEPSEVIPTVMLNNKTISLGKTYEVEGLEKITFKAIATNGGKVTTMAYQIDSGKQNSIAGNEITIEIPKGEAGTTKKIYLNAGGKDSKGNVIQTGWKNITIKYKNVEKEEIPVEPSGEPSEVIPTVMLNNKTISLGKTYEVEGLEKITFKAIATNGGKVTTMAYQIDSGKQNSIAGNEITIEIPNGEAGTTKKIYLNAGGKDSKGNVIQTGWKNITIKYKNIEKVEEPVIPEVTVTPEIPESEKQEEKKAKVVMNIKMNSKLLKDGSKVEVEGKEEIVVKAKALNANVDKIGYYFYANGQKEGKIIDVYDDNVTIIVPTGEAGSRRYLYVEAIAIKENGQEDVKTGWYEIVLNYKKDEIDLETPEIEPEIEEKLIDKEYILADMLISVGDNLIEDKEIEQITKKINNIMIKAILYMRK